LNYVSSTNPGTALDRVIPLDSVGHFHAHYFL
jgi:hypothetical protein